jgi:hypothetical protein
MDIRSFCDVANSSKSTTVSSDIEEDDTQHTVLLSDNVLDQLLLLVVLPSVNTTKNGRKIFHG